MTADNTTTYCSLLLMRDDGRIYRWRIGLRMFYVLCGVLLLLPLLVGIAGWLTWSFHQDNAPLHAQVRRLEDENRTLHITIRRLANLEQLLDLSENAKLSALQNQQAKRKSAEQSAAPPEVTPQEYAKEPYPGDITGQDAATPPPPTAIPSVDLKNVVVENVQVRRQGNNLRVTLDLLNALQKNQIGGNVNLTLKSASGEIFLLEIPKDVASFRISRLKRAVFVPALPAGAVRNLATSTLVIEIALEERGVVYRNEYPIEQ